MMDFRISQGSVTTYCRWGGNPCNVYIENFLTKITWWKNFEKSIHIFQSYYQTSSGLPFLRHSAVIDKHLKTSWAYTLLEKAVASLAWKRGLSQTWQSTWSRDLSLWCVIWRQNPASKQSGCQRQQQSTDF